MEHIKENLLEIKEKIERAAKKSGRSASEIKLVAVSKTFDIEYINCAINLGITDFGENRVQEMLKKQDELTKDVNWHMIGHLQTNKVKQVVGNVSLIHSVDSLRLAEEIDKISEQKGIITDYLIEVNIANEPTKYGVAPENTVEFANNLSYFTNIRLKGLMCVAPYVENGETNREFFANLKNLYIDIIKKNHNNSNMGYLSMGMSCDYETAIEEGANIVRIGTSLFGLRK